MEMKITSREEYPSFEEMFGGKNDTVEINTDDIGVEVKEKKHD